MKIKLFYAFVLTLVLSSWTAFASSYSNVFRDWSFTLWNIKYSDARIDLEKDTETWEIEFSSAREDYKKNPDGSMKYETAMLTLEIEANWDIVFSSAWADFKKTWNNFFYETAAETLLLAPDYMKYETASETREIKWDTWSYENTLESYSNK